MGYPLEEVKKALSFAKEVRFSATINVDDNKSIDFKQSMEIPTDLEKEVKSLLEIAIQYYQRSIFTGEYMMEDDDPPVKRSGEPIDDINFYLGYYKAKLVEELRKAFDLDENMNAKVDKPTLTPFTQAMFDYHRELEAKKKKS